MFLLILFPAATPSLLQTLIGTSLVVLGTAFSIIAVGTLGRSFSIMAEARRLVTRGVYSIVRHPLYLAEEIAVLGIVVQVFSLPAVLLLTLHVAIQIRRMENEETVLKNAFPEYETYMVQTRRLIPGVY
jgi:protein-S-isoprenylcysteine O-methyltransferase Ste14